MVLCSNFVTKLRPSGTSERANQNLSLIKVSLPYKVLMSSDRWLLLELGGNFLYLFLFGEDSERMLGR